MATKKDGIRLQKKLIFIFMQKNEIIPQFSWNITKTLGTLGMPGHPHQGE